MDAASSVQDVPQRGRFELTEQGETAYAEYRMQGEVMIIPYVFSPPSLRGAGTAGRLMEGVLAEARRRTLKVVPTCGYAAAYMRRHAEHHDLLA